MYLRPVFLTKGLSNGQNNIVFNKGTKKERFIEVFQNYKKLLNGWTPTFNNLKGLYLKSGERWAYTPILQAQELSIKEAWADLPQAAIDYLKSLPEFDAGIFAKVTGIEVNNG